MQSKKVKHPIILLLHLTNDLLLLLSILDQSLPIPIISTRAVQVLFVQQYILLIITITQRIITTKLQNHLAFGQSLLRIKMMRCCAARLSLKRIKKKNKPLSHNVKGVY